MNSPQENTLNSTGLCIAGTHSGCGKTTVSMGIMAALVDRGYTVQPFKVGPDFIDPGYHRKVTGRDSHNLDGWIMDHDQNRQIFTRYGRDANISVVEGVMGLFDGFSGIQEAGSTAQMAKWLDLPVILIIDAKAMARSAAAVVQGFSGFDPDLSIKGVICNHVGTKGHVRLLEEAIGSGAGFPLFGCLPDNADIEMPSRHLGLVTEEDFTISYNQIRQLARWIEDNIDMARLLEGTCISDRVGVQSIPEEGARQRNTVEKVKIGIAMDEAFCFYYQENLRLLREADAALEFFSPLHSRHLPSGIQGLILGGGYPELHCKKLSLNCDILDEIRTFAFSGKPVYAECGGLMYLMKEIHDLNGEAYPMAGIFDMSAQMDTRLHTLGYREIKTTRESILGPSGTRVKGHEFHYSSIRSMGDPVERIYSMKDRIMRFDKNEGFFRKRVLGSYVHLHWGSNPEVAARFVDYCRRFGG